MRLCRVTGVALPTVAGVLLRQIHHDPVARHLGDDRGRRDGQAQRIALDDRLRGDGQATRNQIAVDQHMVGAGGHRRSGGDAAPLQKLGALELDPSTRSARLADAPLELSPREYALLESLAAHPGRALSRSQLEEAVYGWGEEVASNAIEVHLHHLRRKLGSGWIKNGLVFMAFSCYGQVRILFSADGASHLPQHH